MHSEFRNAKGINSKKWVNAFLVFNILTLKVFYSAQ